MKLTQGIRSLSLLWLLSLFLATKLATGDESAGFKVIISASNPTSSVSREDASKMFLKKKTRWSNGAKVLPVDLKEDSDTRSAFSKAIHRKKASSIEAYWQQRIFSGRDVPPPKMSSVEEVLMFVEQNPGAIGYVPADTNLSDKCKVLEVIAER